ncbi:tyrosine-type recombinase/integrase [Sporosarcina ureae]|uniref:tyrosine-type recombinase/integrase n=1 Tax=Sporosarcina ureae TaxID=1571 RepID=UPI0018DBAE85|nr:tyrosine-type recombinase/integrase [Sporosarcina ureae]
MRKRRNNNSQQFIDVPQDIRVLFRRFVSIKIAEGISQSTINQYHENFTFFSDFIEMNGGDYALEGITADFIREWITYMKFEHVQHPNDQSRLHHDKGLKASTINTRLKTIRVMFNRMYAENVIEFNPMLNVRNVKEELSHIDVLSKSEIVSLLSVMDTEYYTTFRDLVLTRLLFDTMLRINEALHIRKQDIKAEEGLIVISSSIAKSRKARVVPADKQTLKLVKELIKENAMEFNSEYVFATSSDSVYDRDNYRTRLKRYAESAGIKKNVHPHLLRHTAATRWIESGGGIEELRLILGHSKYDMVKRYAHVANSSVIKSAGKYSLFNNLSD